MPFPQLSHFFYKKRGAQVFLGAEWARVVRGWIWFSPSLIPLSVYMILSFTGKAIRKTICTQLGPEKGAEGSDHTGLWPEAFKASISFHSFPPISSLLWLPSVFSSFSQIFNKVSFVPHKTCHLPGQGLAGVSHSQITNWYNYCFSAFLGSLVTLKHLGCPKFFYFTVNGIIARTQDCTPLLHSFPVFYDDCRLPPAKVFAEAWLFTSPTRRVRRWICPCLPLTCYTDNLPFCTIYTWLRIYC